MAENASLNILIVEDDPEILRLVKKELEAAGHFVAVRSNGNEGMAAATDPCLHVILMDVNLPGVDGFRIVRELRSNGVTTPVLFLTARDTLDDKVRGLQQGGDDYLAKPFAMSELLARINALHRRSLAPPRPRTLNARGFTFDPATRRVRTRGESCELSPREASLLEVLMQNRGAILTKHFLLEKVWDIRHDPGTNLVDALICRLRRRIDSPDQPSAIETIKGQGYIFREDA